MQDLIFGINCLEADKWSIAFFIKQEIEGDFI